MAASKLKSRAVREKTKEHKDFEIYVAFLYEAMGFKVTKNIVLGGQEIDVLAERFFPGMGLTRIAVECKWRSAGSISNQDVYDYSSVALFLRSKQLITRGVMVSNVRYSPNALAAVYNHYEELELLTIGELENQIFDLRQVLSSYVESYERSLISFSYVPLRATWKDAKGRSRMTGDIEEALQAWLRKSDIDLISILGDFGTGKTTLLSRIKYTYSRRYLSGESNLLPLFVPLKRFYGYQSLDEFLRNILVSEFERDVPLTVFWRALAEGKFLVLLDGFDEMAAEADAEKRTENFFLISPLLKSKAGTILTCRPSYFVTDSEYEAMVFSLNRAVEPSRPNFDETSPDYVNRSSKARSLKYKILSHVAAYHPMESLSKARHRVVDLELFDENQVDKFLSKFNADYIERYRRDWSYIKAFLLEIYDLSDLMSRPILLTMINETILDGSIKIGSTIIELGPSSLYEIYTSMKLDLDWLKGSSRRLLSKEDRAAFAESIAVAMYLNGTLEISYATLLELAESRARFPAKKDYLKNIRATLVAADIQVSTFLTRSEDEIFRFSHKSFMEFFVALHLKKALLKNLNDSIFLHEIPKEVLYFLGGFSIPEPSVRKKLISWYTPKKIATNGGVFARNVAGALLYSGRHQEGLRFEDTEIYRIDVRKVVFDAPRWRKVKFVNSDWRDVSLVDGSLASVALDRSTIWGLTVDRGSCELELLETRLTDVEFNGTNVTLRAVHSQMESSKFEGGKFSVSGGLEITRVEFVNAAVEVGVATRLAFKNCKFRDAKIIFSASDCDLERCRVVDCLFDGCGIWGLRVAMQNWESYVEKNLKDCEGVIVIEEQSDRSVWAVHIGGIVLVNERLWADLAKRRRLLSELKKIFSKKWINVVDELLSAAV